MTHEVVGCLWSLFTVRDFKEVEDDEQKLTETRFQFTGMTLELGISSESLGHSKISAKSQGYHF